MQIIRHDVEHVHKQLEVSLNQTGPLCHNVRAMIAGFLAGRKRWWCGVDSNFSHEYIYSISSNSSLPVEAVNCYSQTASSRRIYNHAFTLHIILSGFTSVIIPTNEASLVSLSLPLLQRFPFQSHADKRGVGEDPPLTRWKIQHGSLICLGSGHLPVSAV